MATTNTFEFTDTADNEFIDWDCVWTDWTQTEAEAIKTLSQVALLKHQASPALLKYLSAVWQ